ncbi:MAG: FeoA family protein [Clostridia bacterium]
MEQTMTLNALRGGQCAEITAVRGSGAMHARLCDLGFTENSKVTCLFAAAFGEPRAYCVKDTVIALRCDDAECICCRYCAKGGTL